MKPNLTLPILVLLIFFSTAHATIYRVNGDESVSADFTTLQAAHDAATNGDTIYVEGYSSLYNGNITKKLVLIGSGFFIEGRITKIGTIIFREGSENSHISGMHFVYNGATSRVQVDTDNVTVTHNLFENPLRVLGSRSGLVIARNYFQFDISYRARLEASSMSNSIIANNVLRHINQPSGTGNIWSQNIIHFISGSKIRFLESEVFNNIMINTENAATIESENSLFVNNILDSELNFSADLQDENIIVANTQNIFISDPKIPEEELDDGLIPDERFLLTENSIAKRAGVNGEDLGIFGGDLPYILSGLGGIPVITDLIVPALVNKEKGLRIRFRTNFEQ